ncbi:MAG: cell division protein FtsL [Elusimicrobia bacterium]|nr:cell division protein FtsL [Elusimicrobiota bacterium]
MKQWLAATGAATLVFLFAWEQVQATRLGFELDGARRGVQEARSRHAYLRLELERRTAPAELASMARDRLGMLPPSPDAVVVLEHAASRPSAPIETIAAIAPRVPAPRLQPGDAPPVRARIGTHLLSWLLPPDAPRWR